MKVLTGIFLRLILLIVLFSCSDKTEKEQSDTICVYIINPTCTNGMGCGPRLTFETCDDKINAYKYTHKMYEIKECDCN